MNETIMQFNYPYTVIKEFDSWVVLLRPNQITIGSLVLACKGNYTSLSEVPSNVYSELSIVTSQIENTLSKLFNYDKINYLLLMMRDKYVHFHVIPRYLNSREVLGTEFVDNAWPLPVDITKTLDISKEKFDELLQYIRQNWVVE